MNNTKNFESLLIEKYGLKGTKNRDQYESESLAFRLGVMLREKRIEAELTQEALANKTGTKKRYISRIERGLRDSQISTYQKLIETGLGQKLVITIETR